MPNCMHFPMRVFREESQRGFRGVVVSELLDGDGGAVEWERVGGARGAMGGGMGRARRARGRARGRIVYGRLRGRGKELSRDLLLVLLVLRCGFARVEVSYEAIYGPRCSAV